jgi:YHS domain-containing protein
MRSHLNDKTADLAPDELLDPVCGMKVTANRAAGSAQYQDRKYYFCSTHCLNKFRADPESFTKSKANTAADPSLQPPR